MPIEQNKATLKHMYDQGRNEGNWSVVPEFISPDYRHGDNKGPEGWKLLVSSMRTA
jgi:hypothetical protein